MKSALSFVLLFFCLHSDAQNKFDFLYDISPGVNYPSDMPHVQQWISAGLKPYFLSSLQNSNSVNSDNIFISFSLIGKESFNSEPPNLPGIRMKFASVLSSPKLRSQQIRIMFTQGIKAYTRSFNIDKFSYKPDDYYYLAIQVLRISNAQLVANTLNFCVESGSNKYDRFIDDVNKKMKSAIPHLTGDQNVQLLAQSLDKQFPDRIREIIFLTYLSAKGNDQKTIDNLYHFFAITGFFKDGLIDKIDDLLNPSFKLGMDNSATLEIPVSILSQVKGSKVKPDSLIRYEYKTMEGKLDYKHKKLELIFKGHLNQPALLVNPKEFDYSKNRKITLVKPKNQVTATDFRELKFVISEDGTALEGITIEEVPYQLYFNKWPK